MNNFSKLTNEKKLQEVKTFVKTFPKEYQEHMVREIIINKEDQDNMIKELNER